MLPQCWRLSEQRYRLQGVRCAACGKVFLSNHGICSEHPPAHDVHSVEQLRVTRDAEDVPARLSFIPLLRKTVLSEG